MELLVNQIMRVRDMFSKNEKYLYYFYIVLSLIVSFNVEANEDTKIKILNHFNSLQNFSASFIQNDNINLSEGKFYIGKHRVRVEYLYPTKILIILDEDKAMYYNYELEEDEFFNPKNTNAWFFYDVFRNPYFFKDSKLLIKQNEIILEESSVDHEKTQYLIKVYFENKPLVLRKIEIFINDDFLEISIFNHNYNKDFDRDLFKLINPKFLN